MIATGQCARSASAVAMLPRNLPETAPMPEVGGGVNQTHRHIAGDGFVDRPQGGVNSRP
jgi:hypothetical protein